MTGRQRPRTMREVRSLFNLPSRGSAPKSELVFPASKELQPPSIATPDTLELDASHDASELPLPDDMQVKLDRDSVNAENAKVYDRDLDLANGIRLLRVQLRRTDLARLRQRTASSTTDEPARQEVWLRADRCS